MGVTKERQEEITLEQLEKRMTAMDMLKRIQSNKQELLHGEMLHRWISIRCFDPIINLTKEEKISMNIPIQAIKQIHLTKYRLLHRSNGTKKTGADVVNYVFRAICTSTSGAETASMLKNYGFVSFEDVLPAFIKYYSSLGIKLEAVKFYQAKID